MNEYTVFGTNVMYEESLSKYWEETNFDREISPLDQFPDMEEE